MAKGSKDKRITIRLTDEVYERMVEIAEAESRSLNSQIFVALERFAFPVHRRADARTSELEHQH